MNSQELLEYVRRAKDLEADIYQNQLLQRDFNGAKGRRTPIRPNEPELLNEKEPQPPKLEKVSGLGGTIARTVAWGLGCIICGFGSLLWFSIGGFSGIITGIVLLFLTVILFLVTVSSPAAARNSKINNQREMARYEHEVEQYKESLDNIIAENQRRTQIYKESLEEYKQERTCYEDYCENTFNMICDVGKKLSEALKDLYAENIIYPKYRNMVAVTTIYEYLESGRCRQLDGPDGAYNIYEMELRQNVIIGQLSSIADNLERIKERQFALYNEVTEANQRTNTLLSYIDDGVAFNAYQNKAMNDSLETIKYLETAQYLRHR